MLTLGFTNVYYTLWSVSEPYQHWLDAHNFEIRQDLQYQQNLRLDYSQAVDKIKEMSNGEYKIDLQLRGSSSFTRTLSGGDIFEVYQFTFGQLKGTDIRTCDNVYQVNRAYSSERGGRRRAIAKRRLIELGELIRYTWIDGEGNKHLYAEQYHIDTLERIKHAPVSGHYFTDAAKVELEIREIGYFSFETQYGRTWVCTYMTPDNKMFKYMGANPPEISKDEFVKVKATIKHDYYNTQQETKLQRVKVLQSA